jgi:exosome complex component RRP41
MKTPHLTEKEFYAKKVKSMAKEKETKNKKTSKGDGKEFWVDAKGKRIDGRTLNELRPIKIQAGVLPNAEGSCYLEWGQNKVLVAVNGPREVLPKHQANPYRAIVRYTYRMASFSVTERKNPRPGRREIEISKVSGEALERAIFLERFPNTAIDIFVEVLDSNAGTRIACLTAAAVAVADAGIPMRDLVTGITVGRADGNLLVDLNKHEEDAPDAVDLSAAFLPNSKEVVLLQMDGEITPQEFSALMKTATENIQKVYDLQKKALKDSIETKKLEPIPGMEKYLHEGEPLPVEKEQGEPVSMKTKDPFSFGETDYAETENEPDDADAQHEAFDAGKE